MDNDRELLVLTRRPTPIGTMLLVTDRDGRVRALDWEDYEPRLVRGLRAYYGPQATLDAGRAPAAVRSRLDAYFAGDRDALRDVPVATGGTAFQREVWAALREIPAGTTLSYGALARRVGRPAAVRAVGLANGANPIGVIVPCHRVIGADGSLTGYGGGLERKRWLLAHEGVELALPAVRPWRAAGSPRSSARATRPRTATDRGSGREGALRS